jgi:hypothetical protein
VAIVARPTPPSSVSPVVAGAVLPGHYNKASSATQSVDFYVPVTISGWDFNPLYAAGMNVQPAGYMQLLVTPYVP